MHLGTVFETFIASIFHSETLGSRQVQLGFSVVQRAEPKLNRTHELVCRFLTFLDHFNLFGSSFFVPLCFLIQMI